MTIQAARSTFRTLLTWTAITLLMRRTTPRAISLLCCHSLAGILSRAVEIAGIVSAQVLCGARERFEVGSRLLFLYFGGGGPGASRPRDRKPRSRELSTSPEVQFCCYMQMSASFRFRDRQLKAWSPPCCNPSNASPPDLSRGVKDGAGRTLTYGSIS